MKDKSNLLFLGYLLIGMAIAVKFYEIKFGTLFGLVVGFLLEIIFFRKESLFDKIMNCI